MPTKADGDFGFKNLSTDKSSTRPSCTRKAPSADEGGELLSAVLNLASEAVISISSDRNITVFNKGAEEIFGYLAAEMIGQRFEILLPEWSRDLHEVYLAEFEESVESTKMMKQRGEVSGRRKDGTEFPAEASVSKSSNNADVSFVVVLRDITKRKQAESAVARLGRIVDRSLNEIFLFDAETLSFLHTNDGALGNLGYTTEEIQKLTPVDVKPDLDLKTFEEIVAPLRDGTKSGIVFETLHERKDGSFYDAEVHLELMAAEAPPFFVAFVRDTTKQKEIEEGLRLAVFEADRANRSKSEFLANMSHELRTPLNAILGFSDIMRHNILGAVDSSEYQEYANDIHASGTLLLSLVNDVLDLAKIDAGKLTLNQEPINVADVLSSCERLLNDSVQKSDIKLFTCARHGSYRLFCDERAIKQVILNLLSNAIKFTQPGGQVTLDCEIDSHGSFLLRVTDTGIGIAAADLPGVLAKFSQVDSALARRYEGTGLGLPLVKSLVELHEGTFDLESTVGNGTIATVRFPSERTIANCPLPVSKTLA